MKKLELNLEEIRVDTFATAGVEPRVGTVHAHGSTEETDCTYDNHSECVMCDTHKSCMVTCYDTCACSLTDYYVGCE